MKKRITAACAVLIAAGMLLTGCNNNGGTGETTGTGTSAQSSPSSNADALKIADKYFAGGAESYEAWKGADRSALIATVPEGTEAKDYFDITLGEFLDEYMYYLASYNIADDMSEDNKTTCESYRDNIISYLTFERMYLYIAEHEYGLTEASLTAEQLGEIQSSSEQVMMNWASTFDSDAVEILGENATDEQRKTLCLEALGIILDRCGLGSNIFYKWELSRYIQDLVITELTKNAGEVTDEEVQAMFDEFVNEAKDKAENDPTSYESLSAYSMVYIPEGTRTAKQIMITYSEEDLNKIAQAMNDGDLEALASATMDAYTDEVKAKVNEVSQKLESGTSFDEVRAEYDDSGSSEMIVLKNSPSFFDAYKTALYDIPEKGGVSDPIVYSNGIYFIQYSDDAVILDSDVTSIKESMKSYLNDNKSQSVQNSAYTEWAKRFPYTINYEAIKVDAANSVLAGTQ